MGKPIRFEIDMRGEHPIFTPRPMDEERFECDRHGDIGSRVIALSVADKDETIRTGPVCVACLANMLSCCRAVTVKEESDDQ